MLAQVGRKFSRSSNSHTIEVGSTSYVSADNVITVSATNQNPITIAVTNSVDRKSATFDSRVGGQVQHGITTQGESVDSERHGHRIAYMNTKNGFFSFYSFIVRWADYEPNAGSINASGPGTKRQALLDILANCKANGYRVFLRIGIDRGSSELDDGTNFYSAAQAVKDQNGNFVNNNFPIIGSPPCLADAGAMANTNDFVERVIDHVKSYINDGTIFLTGINTSNAAELEYDFARATTESGQRWVDTDFNPAFLSAFRNWLTTHYANIATINALWGTSYASISAIMADQGDWVNFAIWGNYATGEGHAVTERRKSWRLFRDHVLAGFCATIATVVNGVAGLTVPVRFAYDVGSSWDSLSIGRGSQNKGKIGDAFGQYLGAMKQNDAAGYPHANNALYDVTTGVERGAYAFNEVQEGMTDPTTIVNAVTQWVDSGINMMTWFGIGELPPATMDANSTAKKNNWDSAISQLQAYKSGTPKRINDGPGLVVVKYNDLIRYGSEGNSRGMGVPIRTEIDQMKVGGKCRVYFWDDLSPDRTIYTPLSGSRIDIDLPNNVGYNQVIISLVAPSQLRSDSAQEATAASRNFGPGTPLTNNAGTVTYAAMNSSPVVAGNTVTYSAFISWAKLRAQFPEITSLSFDVIVIPSAQANYSASFRIRSNEGGANGFTGSGSYALDGTSVMDKNFINLGAKYPPKSNLDFGRIIYRRDHEDVIFRA